MRETDISYADWLATVKAYVCEEGKYTYDELAEWYSFETAFDEGKGMLEAYVECVTWLEA
jgi:hypothetical protein